MQMDISVLQAKNESLEEQNRSLVEENKKLQERLASLADADDYVCV